MTSHMHGHRSNVDAMKLLTNTHETFTLKVTTMQIKLLQLNEEFTKLKSLFKDRKKQALIEIEALLQNASACIANIEKGLSAITTPLTFNLKGQISLALNEFENQIIKFDQYMEQVSNKIVTQTDLLKNADITKHVIRFGEHPNRLQLTRRQTSASQLEPSQLDEKRMTP